MGLGVQEVYWIAMPVKGREGRKQYWAQNDFLPQCLSDTCQRKEREKEAGLRGSEGNRNQGEQDRKQRFIACMVTTLIFWASPELNPTFRLQKIYYFLYILVKNRQKMSKKNGKRQKKRERDKSREDQESNS